MFLPWCAAHSRVAKQGHMRKVDSQSWVHLQAVHPNLAEKLYLRCLRAIFNIFQSIKKNNNNCMHLELNSGLLISQWYSGKQRRRLFAKFPWTEYRGQHYTSLPLSGVKAATPDWARRLECCPLWKEHENSLIIIRAKKKDNDMNEL